jgi:Protein of unknown function (DUF3892)
VKRGVKLPLEGEAATMTEHLVTGVRKAPSDDATHWHVNEVCTQGAIRYTRQHVIESILLGNTWRTLDDGHSAEIRIIDSCPRRGCSLGPYIATNPDSTTKENLENLDPC